VGDLGRIEFLLVGNRFGMAGRRSENDPVMWMRLWTLGHRLGDFYKVVPNVTDPDVGAGDPGGAGVADDRSS
jgi:hypothetical protein